MDTKFLQSSKSIRRVHQAYQAESLDPVELTEFFLNKSEESSLGAFLTISSEYARKKARDLNQILKAEGTSAFRRLPLLGIPIAVKDNLTTAGIRTTCGSRILENYVPPYTAESVQRLERAGAILIGKLNMDEFGMGGSNEFSAYGPTHHPTHPQRVPGGSSGGAAAAVKANLCVASLGSDTGGSIRLPASYCGVVGFKPSYGRVSRRGLVAYASSLDQVGPIASSVEDVALLFDILAGHDPWDSTSLTGSETVGEKDIKAKLDFSKIKIGIINPDEVNSEVSASVSSEVKVAIDASIEWFRKKGAQILPLRLPHLKYSISAYYLIAVSEASSNLARFDGMRYGAHLSNSSSWGKLDSYYKDIRGRFGEEVKRRIILGAFALSKGYQDAYYERACKVRRLIQGDFQKAFESVDLILSPVAPTTAYLMGEKRANPLEMYLNDLFTVPANLAGLPALSLPCGQDQLKLPIGLQMIGKPMEDEKLMALAHCFEKEYSNGI